MRKSLKSRMKKAVKNVLRTFNSEAIKFIIKKILEKSWEMIFVIFIPKLFKILISILPYFGAFIIGYS